MRETEGRFMGADLETRLTAIAGYVDAIEAEARLGQEQLEGAFLEWADVFGHMYGTARRDTDAALAGGADLVLVIDVQGARQVRDRVAEAAAIFVLPPSYATLEARLRGRNRDPAAAIERRLATARAEILAIDEYDYVVVNDELERCVDELQAIMVAERARRPRRRAAIESIVATFDAERRQ
jgi:guanylate kinase